MSTELIERKPRKKRMTPLLIQACELYASGEIRTVKGLAEHLNCERTWLGKQLKQPHVEDYLAREAKRRIAGGILKAAQKKLDLLDAVSEHVQSAVASEILAMGGIQAPKEQANTTVNVGVSVGYVVRLDNSAPTAPAIDITPGRDTDAT